MDSCSHPCGNFSISTCTQGVERPFPGNGRDGRVACQESTALSPRCAQMRGVYAHVIHRFIHRPAWLDAPGTTQTTSQAVSSRHRSLAHGGPAVGCPGPRRDDRWLAWRTTVGLTGKRYVDVRAEDLAADWPGSATPCSNCSVSATSRPGGRSSHTAWKIAMTNSTAEPASSSNAHLTVSSQPWGTRRGPCRTNALRTRRNRTRLLST
jgi:hypothetical protein